MKYTKKIYRRGRNQARTRKTAIRRNPEFAKEARRQSRMLRDDPEERKILDALEKIADRTGWKG